MTFKIKLCRDPALVDGWCLEIAIGTHEWYVYPYRWYIAVDHYRT